MLLDRSALFLGIGLALILSWNNIFKLINDWETIPAYSHGFIIPFVSIWIIYLKRRQLAQIKDQPSVLGIGILGIGILCLLFGTWSGLDFLRQISIIFIIGGIIVSFRGFPVLWYLRFPLFYLLFMIPLPAIFFNAIALPLQMIASRGASGLLSLLGIPVFREGNIITMPHFTMQVVQACSGIQSIVSLLAISVLLGYLGKIRGIAGYFFVLSALPIAVFANMIRIAGSGVLGSINPAMAEGFFHLFSGWIVFLFAFASLAFEIKLLGRFREGPIVT